MKRFTSTVLIIITLVMFTNIASVSYANPSDHFTPFRQSQHFSFNIPTDRFDGKISPQQLGQYLVQMDKLYETMADFYNGIVPSNGEKIQINFNADFEPEKTYATAIRGGNVITLSWYAVDNTVEEIRQGNVYWIVAHELGHCFGVEPTFNVEFTADFLTLYASITAGIPIVDWHKRTGGINAELDKWEQNEYNWAQQPNFELNKNQPLHDTRYSSILTCAIINYVKNSGGDWTAIQKTFLSYHTTNDIAQFDYAGSNRAVKFNDFIDRLDFFTQTDFRAAQFAYDDWGKYLKKEFPVVIYNGDKLRTLDAIEILKYLAKMNSVYDNSNLRPDITDAIEILKYLAQMKNVIAQ